MGIAFQFRGKRKRRKKREPGQRKRGEKKNIFKSLASVEPNSLSYFGQIVKRQMCPRCIFTLGNGLSRSVDVHIEWHI